MASELLAAVLVHAPKSIVKFAVNVSVKFENPPNSKAIFFAIVTDEIFLFPGSNLVSSVAVIDTPVVSEELISKNIEYSLYPNLFVIQFLKFDVSLIGKKRYLK